MKTKLLSFLTFLCAVSFSSSFGQTPVGGTGEVSKNMVSRNYCLPTHSGCADVPVTLVLSHSSLGSMSKVIDCPEVGELYLPAFTKIKVTIDGHSSSETYYLPTTIGDEVVILATDGLTFGGHGYTVSIRKTATRKFVMAVSDLVL